MEKINRFLLPYNGIILQSANFTVLCGDTSDAEMTRFSYKEVKVNIIINTT